MTDLITYAAGPDALIVVLVEKMVYWSYSERVKKAAEKVKQII